ncbi:MAG TPA: ROK family protein [Steroidobacteraceae bacterium]|nr:ROK family protein [Steroidobacteraceae bacterium]
MPQPDKPRPPRRSSRILTVDVGGTHVKVLLRGKNKPREFASGPKLTARQMVRTVRRLVRDWHYDAVSIGYPGVVLHGRPVTEPRHLGHGWVGFDYARAFGKPVKMVNDAAMQAIGSYRGGRMLFLGLGTGLGVALILHGLLESTEIGHLPYKKGRSFEEYLGIDGLQRLGRKKWQRAVFEVTELLRAAFEVDYVVLGGGNALKLKKLPPGARLGSNANAFRGGYRLWLEQRWSHARLT